MKDQLEESGLHSATAQRPSLPGTWWEGMCRRANKSGGKVRLCSKFPSEENDEGQLDEVGSLLLETYKCWKDCKEIVE
jgi:hypothetical protein